jgi:hypothetical protein
MGTKRDLAAIEARRLQEAQLLKRKVPQADVARTVGVSRQAVSLWAKQLGAVNGAVGKLKAKPLGRPKWLEAEQSQALRSNVAEEGADIWFSHGAVDDQTSTCAGEAGIWHRLQPHRMLAIVARAGIHAAEAGASCDPARRGSDRAVEAKALAGAKKNARRQGRTIVFVDESGLSEKCPVTRT